MRLSQLDVSAHFRHSYGGEVLTAFSVPDISVTSIIFRLVVFLFKFNLFSIAGEYVRNCAGIAEVPAGMTRATCAAGI